LKFQARKQTYGFSFNLSSVTGCLATGNRNHIHYALCKAGFVSKKEVKSKVG
jgi:hypothetical protein